MIPYWYVIILATMGEHRSVMNASGEMLGSCVSSLISRLLREKLYSTRTGAHFDSIRCAAVPLTCKDS